MLSTRWSQVCTFANTGLRAIRLLLRGDVPAITTLTARAPPDTGYTMNQPHPTPIPSGPPGWDIAFTRLTRAVSGRLAVCAANMERRFKTHGLSSDMQVRQTPRGLSTFMALMGARGLICIVDITLVDGLAVGKGPCTSLEIRLLDACGDVVATGLGNSVQGIAFDAHSALQLWTPDKLAQATTTVYMAALGHFDLYRLTARHA
jgi:hypothetical protein